MFTAAFARVVILRFDMTVPLVLDGTLDVVLVGLPLIQTVAFVASRKSIQIKYKVLAAGVTPVVCVC